MTVFRVRTNRIGGHVHIDVFAAKGPDQTGANCGRLIMGRHEADVFLARLRPDEHEHVPSPFDAPEDDRD